VAVLGAVAAGGALGTAARYGLALAKLLPALLHVTRWSLTATLVLEELTDVPGGVQAHVLGLASGLRNLGHQAEVLAPAAPGDPVPEFVTSAGRALGAWLACRQPTRSRQWGIF
jgi:hypothetical protein